ncbi:MAG: hypothetical protein LBI33_05060, partial [Propionibacteriaceae bacterium]|nr:hypothetical protein [Propionibacteriaceae bacterium]
SDDITVWPVHQESADAYATVILDLLDGLYGTGLWFGLIVKINGEAVFGTNWSPQSVRKPDRERILESLQGVG